EPRVKYLSHGGEYSRFLSPGQVMLAVQRRYSWIEDVELFVRPLNFENFERLTDPAEEWSLRRSISSREFKELKRQKIRFCAEHLSRMAHNAEIIQGWSHIEHTLLSAKVPNPSDERIRLIFQITEAA